MRLKDSFLSLVKGGIIGVSSLIPSLSSGSVMKSLSVYDNFIKGISNIFKKNNRLLYLVVIPLLIGIIAGLLGGLNIVNFFLTKYPNQTLFLFIGLIFGGIKLNYRDSSLKLNLKNIISFILITIFLVLIYVLITHNVSFILPSNTFLKFLIGLFIGLTIIIPGIPLSSYTISLNKYDYLNSMLTSFSINNLLSIILFSLGIIIGIILISKLINYLNTKYKTHISLVFLSFLLVSIIILILNIKNFSFTFTSIFLSILSFLWGYVLAINLEKENDK